MFTKIPSTSRKKKLLVRQEKTTKVRKPILNKELEESDSIKPPPILVNHPSLRTEGRTKPQPITDLSDLSIDIN